MEAGDIYRHFKGNEYEIIAVARDSDDCTIEVVVYRSLQQSDLPEGTVYTRKRSEFEDIHPKYNTKRFTLIKG